MRIGVIFDLDGTLLDSLGDIADSTNHVLRQFGCPERTEDEIRSFVGNGAGELIRLALPGKPGDPALQEVLDVYKAYYAAHCRIKTGPYAGVQAAVAQISGEFPSAVVSNKPDAATKRICAEHFPGIFARGEDADCARKPAPDMVFQAMQALGVERCILVGDSEVDLATAKNAGMPCLSVLWGFRSREELEAAGGRFFCETVEQMPAAIRAIAETEF